MSLSPSATRRLATCPCTVDGMEPCRYACSCAYPMMSGGCSRCATYGSVEQQKAHARFIADAVEAASKPPSAVAATDDPYCWYHPDLNETSFAENQPGPYWIPLYKAPLDERATTT